jgi:hypothetical protein
MHEGRARAAARKNPRRTWPLTSQRTVRPLVDVNASRCDAAPFAPMGWTVVVLEYCAGAFLWTSTIDSGVERGGTRKLTAQRKAIDLD